MEDPPGASGNNDSGQGAKVADSKRVAKKAAKGRVVEAIDGAGVVDSKGVRAPAKKTYAKEVAANGGAVKAIDGAEIVNLERVAAVAENETAHTEEIAAKGQAVEAIDGAGVADPKRSAALAKKAAVDAEEVAAKGQAVETIEGAEIADLKKALAKKAAAHAEEVAAKRRAVGAIDLAEKLVDAIRMGVDDVVTSFNYVRKLDSWEQKIFKEFSDFVDKELAEKVKEVGKEINECQSMRKTDLSMDRIDNLIKAGFSALTKLVRFTKDIGKAEHTGFRKALEEARVKLSEAVRALQGKRDDIDGDLNGIYYFGEEEHKIVPIPADSIKKEFAEQRIQKSTTPKPSPEIKPASSDDEPIEPANQDPRPLLPTTSPTPEIKEPEHQPKDALENGGSDTGERPAKRQKIGASESAEETEDASRIRVEVRREDMDYEIELEDSGPGKMNDGSQKQDVKEKLKASAASRVNSSSPTQRNLQVGAPEASPQAGSGRKREKTVATSGTESEEEPNQPGPSSSAALTSPTHRRKTKRSKRRRKTLKRSDGSPSEGKYDPLFMAKSLVVSSKSDDETRFSTDARQALKQLEEEIQEKHGEPCVVPISTKFSNPKNYREIHKQLKEVYRRSKPRRGNGKWIDPLDCHPQLLTLQSVFMDPLTVTGGKIIEEAKRGMGRVVSANKEKEFCFTGFLKGIDGTVVKKEKNVTNAVVDKETQLLAAHSEENRKICETQVEAGFTPFPYMDVTNLVDDIEHIKRLLATSSGFGLRGLETVCGIDPKKFSLENVFLLGLAEDVETRFNLPQSSNSNFSYLSGGEIKSLGWESKCYHETTYNLEVIDQHYKMIRKLGSETRQKIANNPNQKELLLGELQKNLNECVLKIEEGKVTPKVYLPPFATNIEMTLSCFESLVKELDRLPDCLKPNGKDDMIRILDHIMGGVNSAQMYLKFPVSRTNFHGENGFLVSVNWNFGPHDCVWYFVPPEFLCKFWALIRKKKQNAENEDLWPTPDSVIEAGIPLQKIVQKPLEFIVVGMAAPHWVQSVGFAVNVSWNIAPRTHTQLCFAAIQHDRFKQRGENPLIPLENLMWEMVKKSQSLELDQDTKEFLKFGLMRSLDKCQRELTLLEKLENVTKIQGTDGLKVVERCDHCLHELFNLVMRNEAGENRCLSCKAEREKEGKEDKNQKYTAHVRNTMEDLAVIFDSLVVNAAT